MKQDYGDKFVCIAYIGGYKLKTIRVVTVICWVVIFAIFLGLVGWFITGTVFGARPGWVDRNMPFRIGIGGTEILSGPFNIAGTNTADPAGISSINVDWVSGEIVLRPHDGNNIEITELSQRTLRDNERMSVTVSGDTLEIEFLDRRVANRIGRMPSKNLEILVPRTLSDDLDSLDINSVSGHVDVYGMSITDIDISTTSAGISLSNIISVTTELSSMSGIADISYSSSTTLDIGTVSGRVSAAGAFNTANLRSTSGNISLNNTTVQSNADIDTTSGTVELSGAFYSVSTSSTSGRVSIRSIILPSSIGVDTVSGAITVTIPDEGSITVRHSSVSGRFNSVIPVLLQNRGAQFSFSTVSGNVNIFELQSNISS